MKVPHFRMRLPLPAETVNICEPYPSIAVYVCMCSTISTALQRYLDRCSAVLTGLYREVAALQRYLDRCSAVLVLLGVREAGG